MSFEFSIVLVACLIFGCLACAAALISFYSKKKNLIVLMTILFIIFTMGFVQWIGFLLKIQQVEKYAIFICCLIIFFMFKYLKKLR